VADVFRRYGEAYRQQRGASLSTAQRRAMTAIELCRTSALGGHVERCDSCGHQRIWYNSCRSRSCPKCQSLARAQWLEDRQADLLDTEYFHVVFTIPQEIAVIAYQNKSEVYDILFRAAADTLRTIAADPAHLGAEIGFFGILHTWGQNLLFHPHLRCPWWRHLVGWHALDCLQTRLLPSGPRPVASLPTIVPGLLGQGFFSRQADVLLVLAAPQ